MFLQAKGGRVARAGLTAERLTQAGAEMADDVGVEQVTFSALARHFDVKTASLYSHLDGSKDLHVRITLLALQEMADRGAEALAGRAGEQALQALADVYRDYARQHPGRYAAARRRLDSDTALASAGVRHTQMLRAVLRDYDIPDTEETHAVRLLGSLFHGFIEQEAAGAFSHSTPDPQESWTRALRALDAVLRHWPLP